MNAFERRINNMNRPQEQSILHQALWRAGLDRIERLANIPDAAMRRARWEEDLRAIGDLAAVWALDALIWEAVRLPSQLEMRSIGIECTVRDARCVSAYVAYAAYAV